ncbi:RmlC-like cupin domain-containing protein [Xylaria bambusicola]|uniref:RmlC-like cupin domain-containing protein n=1 Tax=Xylaria bambusicola TaxID=326684 RepID=UPI0020077E4A|nr:RmlC-like cupin domain-containing protein [Xylaria bambusicola]KAI0506943.1 RmlC-like cupin domain-containing protein [Xylaria bambusicola]
MATVSIPSTFASFTETWSPRLVAAVNDQHVKIARLDGPFIFHAHPDSDELFYLLSGELTLEIESGDTVEAVVMKAGDVYVVPRAVRHRPVARDAEVLMIERNDTVNTGDAEDRRRQKDWVDVRGQ